jgi:uncharacterized protein (UPF0335 family)
MPDLTLDERLTAAVRRRSEIAAEVQRLDGRKEAALSSLRDVEDEIRAKGLDPDTLEKTVSDLKSRLESEVSELEATLETAAQALAPFQENP